VIVFRFFPKLERERQLLAEYQGENAPEPDAADAPLPPAAEPA
jgi:hypothetical protein